MSWDLADTQVLRNVANNLERIDPPDLTSRSSFTTVPPVGVSEVRIMSEDLTCKNCGGDMVGDGYTVQVHCETVDLIGHPKACAPDGEHVYCEEIPENE